MRKADYAALADIIRDGIVAAEAKRASCQTDYHVGAVETLESLAIRFAHRASVAGAEFLKACGID